MGRKKVECSTKAPRRRADSSIPAQGYSKPIESADAASRQPTRRSQHRAQGQAREVAQPQSGVSQWVSQGL
jgi:hypothetical protein